MNIEQVIILGCGGHARSVADVALTNNIKILMFLDEKADASETLFDVPVKKTLTTDLNSAAINYFVALGDSKSRAAKIQWLSQNNLSLTSIISKTASIGIESNISRGCFIGHHAHVGPKTQILDGCIINTAAIVEHDCLIGKYTHISVNATVAGQVSIGDHCFIGAGATIINNIKICSHVIIGANSVVIKDINQPGTYVGNPARLVHENITCV